MPKNGKYNGRSNGQKRGSSKLADKKINTLVEKRMLEIAQDEDRKNQVWVKSRTLVADDTFNWEAHGSVLRVPSASCLVVNAGTLFHLRLSDFGEFLRNPINSEVDSNRLNNYVRCRAFKNRFDFRYAGTYPSNIRIWMVEISGGQELSEIAGLTVPTLDCIPKGDMNGLNCFWPRTLKEQVPYKYRIIAQKDITLQPAKLYTDSHPTTNVGSNQGYTFSNSSSVHTEVQKVCYLNKYYKGLGNRFQVNYDDPRAPRKEVYLCIVSDTPLIFNCVSSSEFRLDKIQDQVQPTKSTS